jgi:hypothetical protein
MSMRLPQVPLPGDHSLKKKMARPSDYRLVSALRVLRQARDVGMISLDPVTRCWVAWGRGEPIVVGGDP